MATKYKVGKRVIIVAKGSQLHAKHKGQVGTIKKRYKTGGYYSNVYKLNIELDSGKVLQGVAYRAVEFYDGPKMSTKEKLEEQKTKLEEKLKSVNDRLTFLEETNQEEFNENEFKAYQTLSLIEESELSKAEKAKKIAELIG